MGRFEMKVEYLGITVQEGDLDIADVLGDPFFEQIGVTYSTTEYSKEENGGVEDAVLKQLHTFVWSGGPKHSNYSVPSNPWNFSALVELELDSICIERLFQGSGIPEFPCLETFRVLGETPWRPSRQNSQQYLDLTNGLWIVSHWEKFFIIPGS